MIEIINLIRAKREFYKRQAKRAVVRYNAFEEMRCRYMAQACLEIEREIEMKLEELKNDGNSRAACDCSRKSDLVHAERVAPSQSACRCIHSRCEVGREDDAQAHTDGD